MTSSAFPHTYGVPVAPRRAAREIRSPTSEHNLHRLLLRRLPAVTLLYASRRLQRLPELSIWPRSAAKAPKQSAVPPLRLVRGPCVLRSEPILPESSIGRRSHPRMH